MPNPHGFGPLATAFFVDAALAMREPSAEEKLALAEREIAALRARLADAEAAASIWKREADGTTARLLVSRTDAGLAIVFPENLAAGDLVDLLRSLVDGLQAKGGAGA